MLASGHGSSGQGGFSQSSNTQGTKLTTNRPQPAIVKLEAINLEGFSPEIAAIEARLNLPSAQASMLASSIALEGTTAHSQVAEVRIDLTEKSSVETKTSGDNGSESAAWRKHDQNQEMSQRLTDALGQRLSAQISRGAWRVEMDIHPKSLGRIEIQLEMKNGELEAHFNASKQATRDLLQESMPKLREALDQHGIDSAFIGLGAGLGQGQQGTDGNSTADSRPQRFNQMIGATAETVAEPAANSLRHRLDSTGLDIEI
jgi:flagellar hook-length control protein FliK